MTPPPIIEKNLKYFLNQSDISLSEDDLFEFFRWSGIQRNMRILGTLSKLYTNDNRAFRLKDLPAILDNLIKLIPQDKFSNLKDRMLSEVKPKLLSELNKI